MAFNLSPLSFPSSMSSVRAFPFLRLLRRSAEALTGKAITSKSNTQVRITSKGQVTIPQEFRERFGLLPNTEVEFVATPDGKELRLLKSSKPSGRGRALIERMRGRGTGKRSTDELLKLMRSDV
jgi:AbrB family looped-hinge helix DNA binding protein